MNEYINFCYIYFIFIMIVCDTHASEPLFKRKSLYYKKATQYGVQLPQELQVHGDNSSIENARKCRKRKKVYQNGLGERIAQLKAELEESLQGCKELEKEAELLQENVPTVNTVACSLSQQAKGKEIESYAESVVDHVDETEKQAIIQWLQNDDQDGFPTENSDTNIESFSQNYLDSICSDMPWDDMSLQ